MKMSGLTRRWLDALRSGEYNQTKGCLKNDYGFCCLGVGADVMATSEWRKTVNDGGEYSFRKMGETGILDHDDFDRLVPLRIQDRLSEKFHIYISQDDLATLNDEHGFTFPMIADVVESWWSDTPINPSLSVDRDIIKKKYKK